VKGRVPKAATRKIGEPRIEVVVQDLLPPLVQVPRTKQVVPIGQEERNPVVARKDLLVLLVLQVVLDPAEEVMKRRASRTMVP
jgi:hypothetical protein